MDITVSLKIKITFDGNNQISDTSTGMVIHAYKIECREKRILCEFQWKLKEASGKEDSWESADTLLQALGRVERVGLTFGNEIKTLYLNVTKVL
ncbi:hypothetical protein CW713_06580 [Methanophagales archaeon]|nr:MAG: hypothetical protein CW713_06580 [Methanophagales archaeon]